jgi:hypothetical protein
MGSGKHPKTTKLTSYPTKKDIILETQNERSNKLTEIESALFGVAVGDALGVPVEFNNRKKIAQNPVIDMIGFGTYNLPAGT